MVVIAKKAITEFIEMNPKSAKPLLEWYLKTKEGDWKIVQMLRKPLVPQMPLVMASMYLISEETGTG